LPAHLYSHGTRIWRLAVQEHRAGKHCVPVGLRGYHPDE